MRVIQSKHFAAQETHPGVWTITEPGTSRSHGEMYFVDEDRVRRELQRLEGERAKAENQQTNLFE